MPELWKPVVGYEGYYEVSNHGRVFSIRSDKLLKPLVVKKCGILYHVVNLKVHGVEEQYLIHTLVLTAFVGPRPIGKVACHYDGNGRNNCLSNLRWDTQKGNFADRERHGRTARGACHGSRTKPEKFHRGEQINTAKLSELLVKTIKRRLQDGESPAELASELGFSYGMMRDIKIGKTWRHVK